MVYAMGCYRSYDSDGWETQYLCDGTKHVEKNCGDSPSSESSFRVLGPCDQTCTPAARAVDVRELYRTALACILPVADETDDPNHVVIDDAVAALFATSDEVIGTEFESRYRKRGESGKTVCLGSHHLSITERSDWCSLDVDDGFYTTHRFSMYPCDGSCSPKRVKFSSRERRKLQAALQARGVTLPRVKN